MRWEGGAVLPASIAQETLSAHEKSYFAQYNSLLTEVNESLGMDITSDLEPPKDLLIEVRVLQDCGKVMTDSGPVSLDKVNAVYSGSSTCSSSGSSSTNFCG
eukprot:scaffold453_cov187-Ochromonas_danica.AAC.13